MARLIKLFRAAEQRKKFLLLLVMLGLGTSPSVLAQAPVSLPAAAILPPLRQSVAERCFCLWALICRFPFASKATSACISV